MIAGRSSLDREIGRGGMGAVWLARDEVLGRHVALKRIGLAPGGDSADLERAQREARLAARLNHPHVVAVFDLVDDGDDRWLVMEHVPGTTLAELVRTRGRLGPDAAAVLLGQAADALAAVVDGLGDASRSIDNAELEKTVTKLHDGFATLSDAVDAAASGDITGVAGLATATEDIRAAGAEFARLCSG